MGGGERFIQNIGGETRGKEPLGRLRHRWEVNIKMDLREVGWGGMAWINLAKDSDRWQAPVIAVTILQVKLNALNFLTS